MRVIRKILIFIAFLSLLFLANTNSVVSAADKLSLQPTHRVSVTDMFPDQRRSSIPILRVSYNTGNHTEHIILLNFDISELPEGAEIDSARLILTYHENSDTQNIALNIKRIRETWTQQAATWNNKPDTAGVTYSLSPDEYELNGQQVASFDLTELVTDWVENAGATYGFQIKGPNNITFYKNYYANLDEYPPVLEITYSVPPYLLGTIQAEAYLGSDEEDTTMMMEGEMYQPGEETEGESPDTEQGEETGEETQATEQDTEVDVNNTTDQASSDFQKNLEKNLSELFTTQNLAIVGGAIFLLLLAKIVFSRK
jgi:hypothetical protein